MASGDIVNDIQNVASGAYLTFQPAADVQVVITNIGSSATGGTPLTPKCMLYHYDGSNRTAIVHSSAEKDNIHLLINNALYMQIANSDAGAQYLSYSGIEL